MGKAVRSGLGEYLFTINYNIKRADAAVPYFHRGTDIAFQFLRQPGSPGPVVSYPAVAYFDLHVPTLHKDIFYKNLVKNLYFLVYSSVIL